MADQEKSPLLPLAPADAASSSEAYAIELRERAEAAHKTWIEATKDYQEAWRKTPVGRRTARISTCIVLSVSTLMGVIICLMVGMTAYLAIFDDDTSYLPKPRVALEAHIMSKCPDARDCLRDLVLPAMMQVGNEVDFKLSYIGKTTPDDGVDCLHGPTECLGNILELCASRIYPSPKTYLGFTMCMTKDYSEIPHQSLVQDCALEHGISFDKLNACASDESGRGMSLLRSSVERSAAANVSTSCTIRVDKQVWCVRDDGQWKGCEDGSTSDDLVKKIKGLRQVDQAAPLQQMTVA